MLRTASCLALLAAMPAAAQDGVLEPPPRPVHLNFYGVPGLIDMPSGETLPDAQAAATVAGFDNFSRLSLTFQLAPRVAGTFRYAGTDDFLFGEDTYYDRSFDVRFTLLREGPRRPAVTLGLQDFVGTGVSSAEYLAASKSFGRFTATAGLGWGRLATRGEFDGVGDRPTEFEPTGGTVNADRFFRGPVAPFGGLEYRASDRLSLLAEYSSDAYEAEEETGAIEPSSPVNLGVTWRPAEGVSLGGYYLYGQEVGARLSFSLNAKRPAPGSGREAAPLPVRISAEDLAAARSFGPAGPLPASAQATLARTTAELLREQGLILESLRIDGRVAQLRLVNVRYDVEAQAVGRAARALTYSLPPSVRRFDLVFLDEGVPVSEVRVDRGTLARQEFALDGPQALLAATEFADAARPGPAGVRLPGRYPRLSYGLGPYVETFFFDVTEPLRAELGAEASATAHLAPGLTIDGAVRKEVIGNIDEADAATESELPQVRTNAVRYAQEGDPGLTRLTAGYAFRPAENLYGRVTAGYLERMFGGVSGEVLWKPVDSRLAVGVEVNYARQREFDMQFGFQDYDIVTGHASAYYNFAGGYLAQVDAGRYLAGDYGATFTVERELPNGWRVGAFATFTDVSFEDFGEGSFDKGILLSIPLSTVSGEPARRNTNLVLRPLTRDGGARLRVQGRLYDRVRDYHRPEIVEGWDRVYR